MCLFDHFLALYKSFANMALVRKDVKSSGKVPTGYADEIVLSETSFRDARHNYERSTEPPSKKRKREGRGDSSIVYGEGSYKGPWARFEEHRPDAAEEESGSEEEIIEYEEDEIAPQPAAPTSKAGTAYEDTGSGKETTEFHGTEMYDYQGRTYLHIPQDLDIDLRKTIPFTERKSYTPKKLLHTWKSHTKPITQTRFFPSSGHLLLSGSADTKVKLWDCYHSRDLLRTFSGHTKAVTDVDFDPTGTTFLSASFDRQMKLWDTETGACTARFSTGATPHVVRFNPSTPHEFLAGMSDKKIVQLDVRTPSAKPVQEYDYHLGAVNTIVFCDEDRRFLTTSDDKSLRAWEYSIPVPIKLIAEPYMFSMVRGVAHPSGKYVLYQSSDNQVVVYSAGDKFRQNRKKGFRGHNTAGYAIDVTVSPDGNIVASGDSAGYVCFWDFKTCKMHDKFDTGQGATVSVQWHPRETSKVVTGGLDGTLKYWD